MARAACCCRKSSRHLQLCAGRRRINAAHSGAQRDVEAAIAASRSAFDQQLAEEDAARGFQLRE